MTEVATIKTTEVLARTGCRTVDGTRLLYCLFRPERLLELTYRYMVFDKNIKKVARYQQYFAIGETLTRVTKARGDQQRPGGVIWHTTGSGKSLTMVMLAKALSLEPSIKNPRVVIVTDRIDLDRQIWKTFLACRKSVERANSGSHLVQLVSQGKADIITTIIDKCESAASTHELRDEDSNVFVLVDESHRSQYGRKRIEFQLLYSARTTLAIDVQPDLSVVVTAPQDCADSAVEEKIHKRAAWIIQQQRFFENYLPPIPFRRYVSGESHRYLGRQYRLRVHQGDEEEVKMARGQINVFLTDPLRAITIFEGMSIKVREGIGV